MPNDPQFTEIAVEVAAPEEQLEQVPAEIETKPRRAVAFFTACAILALPAGYLVWHSTVSHPVSANAITQAAASPSIASLEALVHSSPTADNRINLSLAYINGNQSNRAIPLLEGVVAQDGNNFLAWNNLCVANTLQMAYNVAIDDCNHAISAAPNYQLARSNLKWAEDEQRKMIATLAAEEQTAPASRDAAFFLTEGLNYLHVGSYDKAIDAWQNTLERDPRNAAAANNIGTAYMLKKQAANAASWFGKALSMDPSMQLAKNNLAWAQDEQSKAAK